MDILIRFDGPATSKRYFGVQFYLEDLTGLPVDLVTDQSTAPGTSPVRRTRGHSCLMPVKGRGNGVFYVNDMIEFAEKVQLFTDGMDQDTFVNDDLTYDATLRCGIWN